MKIKLDENLPTRLGALLESMGDTVADEGLTGKPDTDVWIAAQKEGRFLITQDLDFSDTRLFQPGHILGCCWYDCANQGQMRCSSM